MRLEDMSEEFKKEKLEEVIKKFTEKTAIPCLKLEVERGNPNIYDSKVGGKAYFPVGLKYPKDSNGNPLRLLAQLNFEKLPKLPDFPERGMLQFFVSPDDLHGANFDGVDTENIQEDFRIIYHPHITETTDVPMFKGTDKYEFSMPFPEDAQFTITAKECLDPMCGGDFRFNDTFMPIFNKIFGTNEISIWKNFDDDLGEEICERLSGLDHKIGGYPGFTQCDPRENCSKYEGHTVLLFQLDSDEDIMWGDCGIANFFIRPEDFKNLDFSNVIYNWDCC